MNDDKAVSSGLKTDWTANHCSRWTAQNVSLPHSNMLLDLFVVDPEEWRTVTWYRRHFSLPAEEACRRVNAQFQAAGPVNNVYVNGQFVGEAMPRRPPFSVYAL